MWCDEAELCSESEWLSRFVVWVCGGEAALYTYELSSGVLERVYGGGEAGGGGDGLW